MTARRVVIVQHFGTVLALTRSEIATAKRRARQMAERDAKVPAGQRIGIANVIERTGLSRSSIYAHISGGDFPRQLIVHGRRKRATWDAAEVARWLRDRTQ